MTAEVPETEFEQVEDTNIDYSLEKVDPEPNMDIFQTELEQPAEELQIDYGLRDGRP